MLKPGTRVAVKPDAVYYPSDFYTSLGIETGAWPVDEWQYAATGVVEALPEGDADLGRNVLVRLDSVCVPHFIREATEDDNRYVFGADSLEVLSESE